jgi:sec-independent protein translocase protein TatB
MFDFSLGEMAVIGAVALVVLGPEKLPKVARAIGQWAGKAQRYVNDVKSDLNREMELSELRQLQEQVKGSARDIENSVQDSIGSFSSELETMAAPSSNLDTQGSWQSTTHEDFVAPSPTLDELAQELQVLRQQLASGQSVPGFKYAPRARALQRYPGLARPRRRSVYNKSAS